MRALHLCDNPPMPTETAREEAVNPLLGQLLRQRGIPARAVREADTLG